MIAETLCPICGSDIVEDILSIENVPVFVSAVFRTEGQARAVNRGSIVLALCHHCSYVWNRSFDPAKMDFATDYDASLSSSPTYERFLDETIERLGNRYKLRDRLVVEVGCGTGHFLTKLCDYLHCRGLGIDPSAPGKINPEITNPVFLPKYYEGGGLDVCPSLLVSRQMFHCLQDPASMARGFQRAIDGHGGVLYVEVPNARYVFRERIAWSIYYEHVGYYSLDSLRNVFTSTGFEVRDVSECYQQGQYLYFEGMPGNASKKRAGPGADPDFVKDVRSFGRSFQRSIEEWRGKLHRFKEEEKRVVVWGGAGRGTAFLNALDQDRFIPFVVDNNPGRQGSFVVGTGHPILSPETLVEIDPDIVILTNATYAEEIAEQLRNMEISPECLVAN